MRKQLSVARDQTMLPMKTLTAQVQLSKLEDKLSRYCCVFNEQLCSVTVPFNLGPLETRKLTSVKHGQSIDSFLLLPTSSLIFEMQSYVC